MWSLISDNKCQTGSFGGGCNRPSPDVFVTCCSLITDVPARVLSDISVIVKKSARKRTRACVRTYFCAFAYISATWQRMEQWNKSALFQMSLSWVVLVEFRLPPCVCVCACVCRCHTRVFESQTKAIVKFIWTAETSISTQITGWWYVLQSFTSPLLYFYTLRLRFTTALRPSESLFWCKFVNVSFDFSLQL